MYKYNIICVTTGEPSGIGPDISLELKNTDKDIVLLIGDIVLLENRAKLLNKNINLIKTSINELPLIKPIDNSLHVLHIKALNHTIRSPSVLNAEYTLKILDTAINLCKNKYSKSIVTGPIHKGVINDAGIKFSGHTEYFAEMFSVPVIMMMSNSKLNVALLTTHVPLKDVASLITKERLNKGIEIIYNFCKTILAIENPRIAVCGLNPHNGENGHFGTEELDVILPTIDVWKKHGCIISCSSADTVFHYSDKYDVILSMYHDQGLPVIKYSDFFSSINVTLGLPIIRTSVDHGTACEIAGSGNADSRSMIMAFKKCIEYSSKLS